jgi:uridine kinase
MHEAFIEPTKKYAHIILPEGGFNRAGLEVLISRLRLALEGKSPLETEAQPTVIEAEKIAD